MNQWASCWAGRLESVIRGREKFHTQTHAGGLTNLEKERKKNFLMVRKGKNSVKRKARLGDKQVGFYLHYRGVVCVCVCVALRCCVFLFGWVTSFVRR